MTKEQELIDAVRVGDAKKVTLLCRKGLLPIGKAVSPDTLITSDIGRVTVLYEAVRKGYKEVVQALLKAGAQVNLAAAEQLVFTPLYGALLFGNSELVEMLLRAGANVDLFDTKGYTLLTTAVFRNCMVVIDGLLKAGAQVDLATTSQCRATPLYIATQHGSKEVVERLLQAGARVDVPDRYGHTPLFAAALQGCKEVVELLLQAGAKVDLVDEDGQAPLFAAATRGYKEVVELLLRAGAKVNCAGKDGRTPLYIAAQNGYKEVLEVLLRAGAAVDFITTDKYKATPLYIAAQQGHKEVVASLLQAGAKVDLAKGNGRTPLFVAVLKGHQEVVALLLQAGANVVLADKGGYRSLCIAAHYGYKEVVEMLLRAGAKVALADKNGKTPLMIALEKGRKEIATILREALAIEEREATLARGTREECVRKLQELMKENRQLVSSLDSTKLQLVSQEEQTDLQSLVGVMEELKVESLDEAGLEEKLAYFAKWYMRLRVLLFVEQQCSESDRSVLLTQADEYFATAKAAFLTGKYEDAIRNYQLAKDIYRKLHSQGVACSNRLSKIKSKMKQVQIRIRKSMHNHTDSPVKSPSLAGIPIVTLNIRGLIQFLLINYGDLTRERFLGAGGFGKVYQGMWQGTEVAIKELNMQMLSENLFQEFNNEAQFMASLRYPHIVQLYGICVDFSHYCLVMEYMPRGSLYNILKDEHELSWNTRWNIILDISLGVNFLHNKGIIHRDLKSLNVLLDKDLRAKLSDFGLATIRTESSKTLHTKFSSSNLGTLLWMAPELFERGGKITKESDMYAYGMVLWEIVTRKEPFAEAENLEQMVAWIMRREKEVIPEDCPAVLADLISKCWQERTQRPHIEAALALVQGAMAVEPEAAAPQP